VALTTLRNVLAEHYGSDCEITSPEDESDAWRAIVDSCRRGEYPDLLGDVAQLLRRSDEQIFDFLRSAAPTWTCDTPADARHSIEVFYAYVDTYCIDDA
jgi:hypothetical protein